MTNLVMYVGASEYEYYCQLIYDSNSNKYWQFVDGVMRVSTVDKNNDIAGQFQSRIQDLYNFPEGIIFSINRDTNSDGSENPGGTIVI